MQLMDLQRLNRDDPVHQIADRDHADERFAIHARRACEMGIPISLNTDSHSEEDMDLLFYGVSTARRAWLTKKDVINCWPAEKLLTWLKKRGK